MERKIQEQLDLLKQRILNMAATVERNIGDAIRGLVKKDLKLLQDVAGRDPEIDLAEIQIDEYCLKLLALQQPVARDLRFVATALKIVKDIERVGDISKDIAQHGIAVVDSGLDCPGHMTEMASAAQRMLTESLDAFVNRDVVGARAVIERDDRVDTFYSLIVRELIDRMLENPQRISSLTRLLTTAKYLERVGDHSSNIAEMVVFLVEGKDIRHAAKIEGLEETEE